MKTNGQTRLTGLMGDPVQHTLSPLIHNTISELMGIDEVYVPFHTHSEGLEAAVKGAYELNVLGLNATVPHKADVMKYLTETDEAAAAIGAVNTLVRTDGGYKGYNTDMMGLSRELDAYGIDLDGRGVIILGAGGAARAVSYMCMEKNASHIYIMNRTVEKAQAIADYMNGLFGRETMSVIRPYECKRLPYEPYVVFQTTSVGLAPDADDVVIEDEDFYNLVGVGVDLIYNPYETKFMQLCREAGARAVNGLRMLLYQAVAAYELWNGVKVPEETVDTVYGRLKHAARRNIVLIGFMGCGKTTVGKALAERAGMDFVDTDEYIEEVQDCPVRDIFRDMGESYFRSLETEALAALNSSLTNTVLATGGGAPLRRENVAELSGIGEIVYLRVTEEEVLSRLAGDDTRPLLRGAGADHRVHILMSDRAPIYVGAADHIVDVSGKTVDEIVDELMKIME